MLLYEFSSSNLEYLILTKALRLISPTFTERNRRTYMKNKWYARSKLKLPKYIKFVKMRQNWPSCITVFHEK